MPRFTYTVLSRAVAGQEEAFINRLRDASGSAEMPGTESLTKVGMIQVAGHLIAEAG